MLPYSSNVSCAVHLSVHYLLGSPFLVTISYICSLVIPDYLLHTSYSWTDGWGKLFYRREDCSGSTGASGVTVWQWQTVYMSGRGAAEKNFAEGFGEPHFCFKWCS